LRHVDPNALAGFRRVRAGTGFVYVDARGRRIRDPATLRRIRRIAIPPAWSGVWVCPLANGHIQAVGRDARGRKQYRYHERWREVRDATKFHKMIAFGAALPRIRAAVKRDLRRRGLPRDKVLATVVRLLEVTRIRVGNEEYARENASFGLTTLRNGHVRTRAAEVTFHFRGKGGTPHDVSVRDRHLARIVRACSELPGHHLFEYVDKDGILRAVSSQDVNGYIHRIAGEEFTAKDFRTWSGTVLAARALRGCAPCADGKGRTRNVKETIKRVAAELRNTPPVCRRSYVHPEILDAYVSGSLDRVRARTDERVVLAVLRRQE
jgi:DNA topoisomerase-1